MIDFNEASRLGVMNLVDACHVLRAFWEDLSGQCLGARREMTARFGAWLGAYTIGASPLGTAAGLFDYGDQLIIVVHGTDDDSQNAPQVAGYLPPSILGALRTGVEVENPDNAYYVSQGQRLLELFGEFPRRDWGNVTVIGHSQGYAAAGQFVLQLMQLGSLQTRQVKLFGFGGNAWGNSVKAEILGRGLVHVRFQNNEDPVPLCPWIFAEAAQVVLPADNFLLRRIRGFCHIGEAINLSETGGTTPGQFPTLEDRKSVV